MISDPIADMLTRIRNASIVAKKEVVIPYSRQKESLAKVLTKAGYLGQIKNQKTKIKNTEQKIIVCELKYQDKKPAVTGIDRISKPGLRVYVSSKRLPRVFSGLGSAIISTPKGMMTSQQARKQKLGGELICKIW